jgi:PEP-CTERM motif
LRQLLLSVASGTILLLSGTFAQADTSTFIVSGEAEAQISTSANTISITLTDLYTDPRSVGDNLSAFIFTTSDTPTSASIANSSGTQVTVTNSGYTMGSAVATGWTLAMYNATTTLDVLAGQNHAGPAQTIIGAPGDGGYSDANRSIAGNNPHNPFLYETATFTLSEAGVTANTQVLSTVFQFGTKDGSDRTNGVPIATPEPSTLALLCGGLAAALLIRRKRTRGYQY